MVDTNGGGRCGRAFRRFRGRNVSLGGRAGVRILRCVCSVTSTLGTYSVVVNESKDSIDRVATLNGPTILVPSPGITKGRRRRGTETVRNYNTTQIVLRGSLGTGTLNSTMDDVVSGRRMCRGVSSYTEGVNVAGTASELCDLTGRLVG